MKFEVCRDRQAPDGSEWRVEAIDHQNEGVCYVTIFSGPFSEKRAREYLEWVNSKQSSAVEAVTV